MSPSDCLKFNTHTHPPSISFLLIPRLLFGHLHSQFPSCSDHKHSNHSGHFSFFTSHMQSINISWQLLSLKYFQNPNYLSLINQQGPWIKPSLSELLQQLRSLCLFAPVYSPHSSQCNCLNFKSWWIFPLLRISKGITMQKALYDLVATPSLTSFLITCFLNPSAIISSFEVTLSLCEVHSP